MAKYKVNNLPSSEVYNDYRYMIIRQDENGQYWFYDNSNKLDEAYKTAVSLGNGLVIETWQVESEKSDIIKLQETKLEVFAAEHNVDKCMSERYGAWYMFDLEEPNYDANGNIFIKSFDISVDAESGYNINFNTTTGELPTFVRERYKRLQNNVKEVYLFANSEAEKINAFFRNAF